jgi:hypothetical protein
MAAARKLATTVVLSDPASFQPVVLLEGEDLPEQYADQVGEHALVQADTKSTAKADPASKSDSK